MAKFIMLITDTATLARAMYDGSDLRLYNAACEPKMQGSERVLVVGKPSRANIMAESWIVDRFGALGARQIKRLQALCAMNSLGLASTCVHKP